eukprot:TRINITY_DN11630_c0_g1_i1.p1 TRINITY_DN11630_c0_g1~~TRINITY_DN11630_c0_g1_i1.p1  ORF type:complete len:420 (+),score=58.17 TRINITY_DN11630_c0_g1_i1:36-1295(+)
MHMLPKVILVVLLLLQITNTTKVLPDENRKMAKSFIRTFGHLVPGDAQFNLTSEKYYSSALIPSIPFFVIGAIALIIGVLVSILCICRPKISRSSTGYLPFNKRPIKKMLVTRVFMFICALLIIIVASFMLVSNTYISYWNDLEGTNWINTFSNHYSDQAITAMDTSDELGLNISTIHDFVSWTKSFTYATNELHQNAEEYELLRYGILLAACILLYLLALYVLFVSLFFRKGPIRFMFFFSYTIVSLFFIGSAFQLAGTVITADFCLKPTINYERYIMETGLTKAQFEYFILCNNKENNPFEPMLVQIDEELHKLNSSSSKYKELEQLRDVYTDRLSCSGKISIQWKNETVKENFKKLAIRETNVVCIYMINDYSLILIESWIGLATLLLLMFVGLIPFPDDAYSTITDSYSDIYNFE